MNLDAKAKVLDNEPRRGKHSLIARALGSVIIKQNPRQQLPADTGTRAEVL